LLHPLPGKYAVDFVTILFETINKAGFNIALKNHPKGCVTFKTKGRKVLIPVTALDVGILVFVVGTLALTGIWYLKEEAELPKYRPASKTKKHPREGLA